MSDERTTEWTCPRHLVKYYGGWSQKDSLCPLCKIENKISALEEKFDKGEDITMAREKDIYERFEALEEKINVVETVWNKYVVWRKEKCRGIVSEGLFTEEAMKLYEEEAEILKQVEIEIIKELEGK